MTKDDMEAETRLLLAKHALRDAKYPWLMFVPAIVAEAIGAAVVAALVLVGAKQ